MIRNEDSEKEILEELKCGICLDLLVDPTSLSCGHTVCRYCLAQWWFKAKKKNCPQCRHEWSSFPKINVTLRNTINSLYSSEVTEKTIQLSDDPLYHNILGRFEALGENEGHTRSTSSNFSWTAFSVLVAVVIGVIVIVNLGIKNFGSSEKDLKSKSLERWTAQNVGVWVASLGDWAKPYQENFVNAGINGDLLKLLSHEELADSKINMTTLVHRKMFLLQLDELKSSLPASTFDIWSYKERQNEMAMFIMLGIREFPRATIAYLYLFNYWDVFLPFFFSSTSNNHGHPIRELLEMDSDPTIGQWLEFLPWYLVAPYGLIAKFASHFMEQHYWTARFIMLHALFMTLTEFSKFPSLLNINMLRKVHIKAIKYFTYVLISSLVFKLFWSFVPSFIADCIFYWILYVSPFDATNRLLKRVWRRRNQPNAAQHQHGDSADSMSRQWSFDIQWHSHTN